jgi:hypothetical protein
MTKSPLVIKVENIPEDMEKNLPLCYSNNVLNNYFPKNLFENFAIFTPNQEDCDDNRKKNEICILYPNIVILTANPVYHKLGEEITSLFEKIAECKATIVTDLFSYFSYCSGFSDNQKRIVFDIGYISDDGRFKIDAIDEDSLLSYNKFGVTEHTIYLSVDRFGYIMNLLNTLDNGFDIFRRNIQIFCSAFVKFHTDENYKKRIDNFCIREEWLKFAESYSATIDDAIKAFDETVDFSYSIITIEEILKDESKKLKKLIDKYNKDRFEEKVKRVLITKDSEITLNDMTPLFAEYIRRDHFYCEGKIHCFKYPTNVVVEPNDLSDLVNSFLILLKSISEKICRFSKTTIDESAEQENRNIMFRYNTILKAFSNEKRNVMIKNSCANYLNVSKLTKGSSLNKIVFKDYCYQYTIIDKEKTLTSRKCYMEDRFFGYINYDKIHDFNKTEKGKEAIERVYKTYRRMFKYEENVNFFISWLGSIIVKHPERCIVFMMGKDGENAKTSVVNALAEALGNNPELGYAKTYHPSMFYASAKAGITCDPYWAIAEGALLASLPETNSKYPFSCTIMKETSGGDMKMAAQKFKNPIVFKHSAKLVITGNDWIVFDNFDKALQSRMFPLICHGKFKQDPKDVPKTEKEQDEKGIYLADPNFWNSEHIKAQLWIMFNDGFDLYKKQGLLRTEHMEKDLAEWLTTTSNYIKFTLDIEYMTPDGKHYLTTAEDLKNTFAKKFNKLDLSIEDFVSNFEKETGKRSILKNGIAYYQFKHKESKNFQYEITEHKEHHTHEEADSPIRLDEDLEE